MLSRNGLLPTVRVAIRLSFNHGQMRRVVLQVRVRNSPRRMLFAPACTVDIV
jgi:hypothetical protein